VPGESKSSPRRIAATERQRKALELRKAGASYDQIAKQLGYRGRSGAHKSVMAALKKTLKEPAESVRKLELARLDEMLLALWPQVKVGNHGAIDRALKIMQRRAALQGLDEPKQVTFDWRREAREAGLDPSAVFEQYVQAAADAMGRGEAEG
jgi:hypothetical protein